jgi:ubiquinone/menaquinone biosynthesis C-methylase UbiE
MNKKVTTSFTKNKYKEMKDFEDIYKKQGAYHVIKSGFNSWWLDDNYRLIASKIHDNESVLDLACGDGKLCEFLPNELLGIDNSPSSLKLNRKYYPKRYKKLLIGDMRELNSLKKEIGEVDVIVCSLSFMYLIPSDLKKCLMNLRKVLKKDGKLIFTYPNVSKYRLQNPTSAELPFSEIKAILKSCNFNNIRRFNICPLQPAFIVRLSKTVLFPFAKIYYIMAKLLGNNNNDKAYHYMVVCTS